MKVAEVINGIVTSFPPFWESVEEIPEGTADIYFDAPDYVEEGWLFDGVSFSEPPEPPDESVDRAVVVEINGKWFVQGFRDGVMISQMGGWSSFAGHVNAIFYDNDGNVVPHEYGEFTPVAMKLEEIGLACSAIIHAGVVVGGKKYSLTEHDQIELMAQRAAVLAGALFVPYHADGELCRMFSAAEFMEVADAAVAHIFYHRTYCNHVNIWVQRADEIELDGIQYGANLPSDLAEHMAGILAAASGQGDLA